MSRPLAVVLPSFAGGGAERVALTLVRHMAKNGGDVHLVVLSGQGPLAQMVPAGLPVHDLQTPRLRSALPAMIGLLRRLEPGVVFSTLGYMNLALLALKGVLPTTTKVIVREANLPSLSLPNNRYSGLFRWGYKFLYPKADKVVCTSKIMVEEMARDLGVPSSRLAVHYNPVDETSLRGKAEPPIRYPGEGRRFVCAGRLTRQKGFDRLLRRMACWERSCHLTILGDGADRPALERLASEHGVAGNVLFAGFCDNPWRYYAGADAFLLPSRWEGMPNAALEALACGTKVIAAPEAGAISEIADLAEAGAVTLAAFDDDFDRAIEAVDERKQATVVAPSLLPGEFKIGNAIEGFAALLEGKA